MKHDCEGQFPEERFVVDRRVLAGGLFVLTCAALGFAANRGRLLDDAYIHLRYAWHLLHEQRFEYNLGEASSGSSAVGYTALLAVLGLPLPRQAWPVMIQAWSVVGWFSACACWANLCAPIIDTKGARSANAGGATAWRTWVVALATALLFTPSATARWFHDGMETSTVTACAFGVVFAVHRMTAREQRPSDGGVGPAVLLGALVAAPFLVRIDGVLITAGALLFVWHRLTGKRRTITSAVAVSLVAFNLAALYVLYDGRLPDSMIAKGEPAASYAEWLVGFCKAMVTASPLWFASLAYPCFACSFSASRTRETGWRLLIAFGPIVALCAAGLLRKQAIHGARYFLPALAWALAACLHFLALEGFRVRAALAAHRKRLLVVGLLSAVHGGALTYRSLGLRSSFTLPDEVFGQDVRLMAFDVGVIGWNTQATILDLAGLVNGRQVAEAPLRERPCLLIERLGEPHYLLARRDQAAKLGAVGDVVAFQCARTTYTYENSGRVLASGDQFAGNFTIYLWEPRVTMRLATLR